MPVGVHGRAGILRHDHVEALVGPGPGGVLDAHVGPGAAIDDRVASAMAQIGFQPGGLPGAHAHLLDHQIAGLRGETIDRRCAPSAAHQGILALQALHQFGMLGEIGRAGLDQHPDMQHHDAAPARHLGQPRGIGDDVLGPGMVGRAGGGKGAAVDDDVVLQVLQDQGGTRRVDPGVEPRAKVQRRSGSPR